MNKDKLKKEKKRKKELWEYFEEVEGDKLYRILLRGFAKAQRLDYRNVLCTDEAFTKFHKRIAKLQSETRERTLEEVRQIIENDSKEATRVAVKHSGYKLGWHWKSIGEAYVRNKYRKQLLEELRNG